MISELNDVSIRTMIGQLPSIINKNNDVIEQNFDNIYDSSLNKIIKPVDTTQNNQEGNYVKSHTGNFLNIICDNIVANKITVKDIVIEEDVEGTSLSNHAKMSNRFFTRDSRNYPIAVSNSNSNLPAKLRQYAHNAGAIGVYLGEAGTADVSIISLQDVINMIPQFNNWRHTETIEDYDYDANGNKRYTIDPCTGQKKYIKKEYSWESNVNRYGASNPNSEINESLEEPNSFTFDNNVLFASNIQLKRMNLPQYQYNDIKSGNLFTYYDYSPVITITDEYTSSLKGIPGSRVKIKFNDLKKKAYYRIILSRKDKKYLRISKDELLRLNLICESTDDVYGTIWDVDTYCVRHPEDLIIETK